MTPTPFSSVTDRPESMSLFSDLEISNESPCSERLEGTVINLTPSPKVKRPRLSAEAPVSRLSPVTPPLGRADLDYLDSSTSEDSDDPSSPAALIGDDSCPVAIPDASSFTISTPSRSSNANRGKKRNSLGNFIVSDESVGSPAIGVNDEKDNEARGSDGDRTIEVDGDGEPALSSTWSSSSSSIRDDTAHGLFTTLQRTPSSESISNRRSLSTPSGSVLLIPSHETSLLSEDDEEWTRSFEKNRKEKKGLDTMDIDKNVYPLTNKWFLEQENIHPSKKAMTRFRSCERHSLGIELFNIFSKYIFQPEFEKRGGCQYDDKVKEEEDTEEKGYNQGKKIHPCWGLDSCAGTIPLIWKSRMKSTAGRFFSTKKGPSLTEWTKAVKGSSLQGHPAPRYGWIALSVALLDTPDRLAQTLLHEMCHSAQRIIDEFHFDEPKEKPHGPRFKSWGKLCASTFPEFASGMSTCHDYDAFRAFRWRCVSCHHEYRRHSKSIDMNRHRCAAPTKPKPSSLLPEVLDTPLRGASKPICHGHLESGNSIVRVASHTSYLLHHRPHNLDCHIFRYLGKFNREGNCTSAPQSNGSIKESPYRAFHRNEIKTIKTEYPTASFAEVMRELGQRWAREKQHRQALEMDVPKGNLTPFIEVIVPPLSPKTRSPK